jgi:hypothetical protein
MNPVTIRAPAASEPARVQYLFRHVSVPARAQLFVAVKMLPVERFVGAVAGWLEADFCRIQLVCLPGTERETVARLLIAEAAARARSAGVSRLLYADLLPDDHEQSALLRANGFEVLRSERAFSVDAREAEERTAQMMNRHRASIPASWSAEPIRRHQPEVILDLIAPFRLMPPAEICHYWRPNVKRCFDPDFSSILFDGRQALGTLLARRTGDVISYDVRVVSHPSARMRGLVNLCLFYHNLKAYDRSNPVRWLQFRGGEFEHRETANLAFRLHGVELPPRRLFARTTQDQSPPN